MEIIHRITVDHMQKADAKIDALGIEVKRSDLPGGAYILTFEIAESDARWPEVSNFIAKPRVLDITSTKFSREETMAAEWVRVYPWFERDYPQPWNDSSWLNEAKCGRCKHCGAGYHQVAPYLINREPRLGKKQFVSLIGTYSIFCTLSVAETLEREGGRGLTFEKPTIKSTGRPSEVVTQWQVSDMTKPGLLDDTHSVECPACGLQKFEPHRRGYMQMRLSAFDGEADVYRSHEWFGSGHMAFQEYFLSQRLARHITIAGYQGISLLPVELVA